MRSCSRPHPGAAGGRSKSCWPAASRARRFRPRSASCPTQGPRLHRLRRRPVACRGRRAARSGRCRLASMPARQPLQSDRLRRHPASRRPEVASLAPDQYKITFTASAATCQKLRQAQDLLRHQVPDGNPAEIFDRALSALLEDLARKKLGASDRPRRGRGASPGSRHIPAEVKRAVWLRDGGSCAFVAGMAAAATSEASWNFITSCPTPPVVRPRYGTSASDVVPTTDTRRSSTSGRGSPLGAWTSDKRPRRTASRAAQLVLERVGPAPPRPAPRHRSRGGLAGAPTARHRRRIAKLLPQSSQVAARLRASLPRR